MTSTKLKILAVILMVCDHICQFIPNMPVWLRWLGRGSAPIFVFCIVWSINYTKNKKYIFRLYLASIVMETINFIMFLISDLLFKSTYTDLTNNMFRTLFLLSVVIYIYENTNGNFKKRTISYGLFFLWEFMSCFLFSYLNYKEIMLGPLNESMGSCILGGCKNLEGGFFIVLGFGIYLFKEQKKKLSTWYIGFCILFFLNSALSIIPRIIEKIYNSGHDVLGDVLWIFSGSVMGISNMTNSLWSREFLLYDDFQWMMIFALPLILCYNNKKGNGYKYFFYIIYPVHIIVLYILGNCIYNI